MVVGMRNNKKAIMYKFLVRLIIGIFVFISVMTIASNIFLRTSDKALDSYRDLVGFVQEVNENEGDFLMQGKTLHMDKDTYIVGIDKNVDYFEVRGKNILKNGVAFIKPSKFKDKSVICLCREYESDVGSRFPKVGGDWFFNCVESFCSDLDVDFLPIYTKEGEKGEVDFIEGFVLQRGILLAKEKTKPIKNFAISDLPRLSAVYVEKYKDLITVCTESPCISEEMKEPKYDAKESEVGDHEYSKGKKITVEFDHDRKDIYEITGFKKNN